MNCSKSHHDKVSKYGYIIKITLKIRLKFLECVTPSECVQAIIWSRNQCEPMFPVPGFPDLEGEMACICLNRT